VLLQKCKSRISPTFEEKDADFYKWKPMIRLRIVSFIQKWTSNFWFPDFVDEQVKQEYIQFVDLISASFGDSEADKLLDQKYLGRFRILKSYMYKLATPEKVDRHRSNLSMMSSRQSVLMETGSIVVQEKPKIKMEFLDIDPDEMTMAFTLREQELLSIITPATLANHLWGSHKEGAVADQIKPINDSVQCFNTISYWVATEICTQPGIDD
jgi:hypothetical protein